MHTNVLNEAEELKQPVSGLELKAGKVSPIGSPDKGLALADLKGMELRVGGPRRDIIKRLGGIPVAMPQSDTPEALQKGVVKGHVSSMEVLKDFNYAAYTANATITNLWVVSFAVVMNQDKWASLPADVKKVFDVVGRILIACHVSFSRGSASWGTT
jgi:hypothetical protein